MLMAAFAFAERAPVYISPNNDGVQDELEVPLKIKEARYVSEWSFRIYNDKGEIVRIIGNKEKRDESISFKNFFKQLFTPKQGVEIPSSVIWNGYFDDGRLAPDGNYYYQFSATDDNGNTATTSKLLVVVDNTAPVVTLGNISESDRHFGEGSKSTLRITQQGSKEDLWTAKIYDSSTKEVVRSYSWETAEPLTVLEWDGSNEEGSAVPDGVYTYEVTSTDNAGNKAELTQLTNIIYSAEKPVVSVSISGSRYFSPNGDGVNDSVKLLVTIPRPTSKINSMVGWKIDIIGTDGKVYRTYSGTDDAPSVIDFDGKNQDGVLITKTAGQYVARVTAKYSNGFETAAVDSPVFVLDNVAPEALVRVNSSVFNGSGNLEISQKEVKPEESWTGAKSWTGKIVSEDGKVVKEFDFGEAIPEVVFWNGTDANGSMSPDATYHYELKVVEPAGNVGLYNSTAFTLDTSKTELMLSAIPEAFSPRLGQIVTFAPVVKANSGVESYTLSVLDASNKPVKTFSGTSSVPAAISWNGNCDADGSRCPDGIYSATLEVTAKSGSKATVKSHTFAIDTVAPEIEVSVPYTVFSPDGVSSRQTVPVKVLLSSKETKWVAEVRKSNSAVGSAAVKTFTWQNSAVADFEWDGTDESGNKASDGTYTITVSSKDAAGNSGSAVIKNISLDTREAKIYLTAESTGISPNGDNVKESQKFTIKSSLSEGIKAWSFDVVDTKGTKVKSWTEADSANLPQTINWNGDTVSGTIGEGTFKGVLHVEYEKGNICDAESASFICTAIAPQLDVQTVTQNSKVYFSPDNDGIDDDLYIRLRRFNTLSELKNWSFVIYDRNHNEFWKTSGKSTITERLIWDGRGNNGELVQSAEDYSYEFTAEDELGMKGSKTGVIHVDVLVVRDGNKLKMQVPSIIFRSDNADFYVTGEKDSNGKTVANGITPEQKQNNEQILRRIALILEKFKDYKVTVVGHANRITDNPNEETVDNMSARGPALIPLSNRRAEFVKQILVGYGVNADRLSVDGKGGTEPVADTKDKSVNWKNRRVEFILEK